MRRRIGDPGRPPPHLAREVGAAPARHDLIAEDGVDGVAVDHGERGVRVGGLDDVVLAVEHAPQEIAVQRLVVDDEDDRARAHAVAPREPLTIRREAGPAASR